MNSAQLHVVITGAVCLAMTTVLAALVRWVVIPLCDADEGSHARPRRWARMRRRLRAARYLPWEWWWAAGWRPGQWARRPRRWAAGWRLYLALPLAPLWPPRALWRTKEVMPSAPVHKCSSKSADGLHVDVLRRRMTLEASPASSPGQGTCRKVHGQGAAGEPLVKARRGTLAPGLPGPRRLRVRSRLRRRALPPADAHTVALFQQMAGHHAPHPAVARMVTLRALTLYFGQAAWAAEQACPRLDYAEAEPLADWLSDTWVGGIPAITSGGQS